MLIHHEAPIHNCLFPIAILNQNIYIFLMMQPPSCHKNDAIIIHFNLVYIYIYIYIYIKGVKTFPLNVEGCRDGSTKK